MKKSTLWIIAAPSCVGKSTFIKENDRLFQFTGLKKPRVYAADKFLQSDQAVNTDAYLHISISFSTNFVFCEKLPIDKHVIILVATRETMLKRAAKRADAFARGENVPKVPPRKHLTDEKWREVYKRSVEQIENQQIPYTLLNTEESNYPIISKEEYERLLS